MTYVSMQKQNALEIPSPHGGGQKGHIGLTMQDNLYFACYSHHFTIPDPSPYPNVPASTMAAHHAELEATPKDHKKAYDTALAM